MTAFLIRELMKDTMFDESQSEATLSTWQSLKSLVKNFMGNLQSAEYKKETEEIQKSSRQLGSWMSVKVHFLSSH